MQETNLISDLTTDRQQQWDKLTSVEKSLVKIYVSQLKSDNVSLAMVKEINKIYDKYPDFDVSCAP